VQPSHATSQTFQRSGCDANGSSAVLQAYENGVWTDFAVASGRKASATCDAQGPGWGSPYVSADLPVGTLIRWHIYAPDNAWSVYVDEQTVEDPSTHFIYSRNGALSMDSRLSGLNSNRAWVGSTAMDGVENKYNRGFSYYTQVFPLFPSNTSGLNASAGVTWIQPVLPSQSDYSWDDPLRLCAPNPFNGNMQSMEGGLAWDANQYKYPTLLPKFKIGGTANCYQTQVSTPGWDGFGRQLDRENSNVVQISNKILIPPDGITFAAESAGGMLGIANMALPFPQKSTDGKDGITGANAWTTFLNTSDFHGPIAYYLPQMWSSFASLNPVRKGLSLDQNGAYIPAIAMEWGEIPFMQAMDSQGTIFSKIPKMQFPIDSQGNTVLMEDVSAYSSAAYAESFSTEIQANKPIPSYFNKSQAEVYHISASPQVFYQNGSQINIFGDGKLSSLFGGVALGFSWPVKSKVITLPDTYMQTGDSRVAVDSISAPAVLVNHQFPPATASIYTYSFPSWWKPNSANDLYQAHLVDGSTLTYEWVRFIDQPAFLHLDLTESEKMRLQTQAENIQRSWDSANSSFMGVPTSGSLAKLDSGLSVTPPIGMEIGYVPIVIGQTGSTALNDNRNPLTIPDSVFSRHANDVLNSVAKSPIDSGLTSSPQPSGTTVGKSMNSSGSRVASNPHTLKIVCIKGMKKSILSGINKKCPVGYKRGK
jgi:hypothetical protein